MEHDYISVYITAKDTQEAEKFARLLLDARLAACINVVPQVRSFYRWEGEIVCDTESVLFCKTRAKYFEAISRLIKENSGYSVPCVLALPILDGFPAYLAWVDEQLSTFPDNNNTVTQ